MDRPTDRIDVNISDASDRDGGGVIIRCAAHGTDIINHACRLCAAAAADEIAYRRATERAGAPMIDVTTREAMKDHVIAAVTYKGIEIKCFGIDGRWSPNFGGDGNARAFVSLAEAKEAIDRDQRAKIFQKHPLLINEHNPAPVYCAGCGRTVIPDTDTLGHFHSTGHVRRVCEGGEDGGDD